MRPWIAVAAASENRVIGRGGELPWHLPEDFRWFKKLTMGHTLVMGRKTFDSIGRPLPGRQTIVLSRSRDCIPGVTTVGSADAIDEVATGDKIFVCGGAEIYSLLLPRCQEVFFIRVKRSVEGDRFMPPFEEDFDVAGVVEDNPDFTIIHYARHPMPPKGGTTG